MSKRVLIASANPLFGRGLERQLKHRSDGLDIETRLVSKMDEALELLKSWEPDLAIVDYDDRAIQRLEFLNHVASDARPVQVIFVSLQASGAVEVYNRRTMTAGQLEEWFDFFSILDQENL
jgi:cytochrome c oxidase subunit II